MSTVTASPWSREGLTEFLAGRQEPGWLTQRREQAWELYQSWLTQPLDPEEYKRVDLRLFRPDHFHWVATPACREVPTLMASKGEFGGTVVHVDGHAVRYVLDECWTRQGVIFTGMSELLAARPEVLQPWVGQIWEYHDQFAAWHTAFCTGGCVLLVPRGIKLSCPLHSVIALASPKAADFSHTLVILEEGAEATLLEETVSANAYAEGLHMGAVTLLVGRGATLRYVQLQNWNQQVWHLARQTGYVAEDANLQWTVGALGAKLAHIHQHVHLQGRGGTAEVNGVTFATHKQRLSYYTQQSHHAPQTRSDLLYKDVLRDQSRVIWRGMIKVDPEAQHIDGYQRNDALLLSDHCRADLIPGLEIEADDVRCTHGATAGCVDTDQLLYCMSRGVPRDAAMHLIVEGFFERVYARVPVPLVRETLRTTVRRKLGLLDRDDVTTLGAGEEDPTSETEEISEGTP
ncbi:MAG: Fe-S cluster assembly protein SufD [Planctomycetaceae bacterium]|nr:MAG: Fe-S cluster assembly protein SufD [Planctomycetaceae bacterium]